MQKSFWCLLVAGICSTSYANEAVRAVEQSEVNLAPVVNEASHQADLLKQSAPTAEKQANARASYSERELLNQPNLLERLLVEALILADKRVLSDYAGMYKKWPDADHSLIEWANAILEREKDLNQSVTIYRNLISHFPENSFIRFQLAETLFYNQEFEAAKDQLEKLRAESKNSKDIEVFNRFIDAIQSKEKWNFSFGASFLNDKNLTNSAKPGTSMQLPNGMMATYTTPRQSGQGISSWLSADKQWNIKNGNYLKLNSALSSKYYWDNKSFNDLNLDFGFGWGYSNARFDIELLPNVHKRWYAGGVNSGKSLKQYTDTYGATLSSNYWLNQKLKYSFNYDYSYEKYEDAAYKRLYNGAINSVSNSITYLPNALQYWALSLDVMYKNAKNKANAYNRVGSRLTWGKEWPWGISTSSTLGFAKRHYKAPFVGAKQKNKEYSASVSLWHKKLHYAGFTPRVTYSYTKTDSNIPIYSYDKHQVLFNVVRSF